jgi:TusA-related sulfurtransferase
VAPADPGVSGVQVSKELRSVSVAHTGTGTTGVDRELDLRGEVCPYTFLKARLALEEMRPGQVLRVVVDSPASLRDVPRSLEQAGHRVLVAESGTILVQRR